MRNSNTLKDIRQINKDSLNKKLFKAIFSQSLFPVVLLDQDYNIIRANKLFLTSFSLEEDIAEGKNIEDLIVPSEEIKNFKKFKKQLLEHGFFSGEIIRKTADGIRKNFYLNTIRVDIPDENPLVYAFYEDITDRKAEERKNRLLSRVMRNISDSVVVTDSNFKIIENNKQAEKLFGYTIDELKGKTPDIFNAEENSEEIQQQIYSTLSEGENYHGESINKRKDGSTFICEYKITPMLNDDGQAEAYISIQRDVTEERKSEKTLRDQYNFEQAIADVSSKFINMKIENIDEAVDYALKRAGECCTIDRSYIFEFHDQGRLMSNTYEWTAEGIESQKEMLQDLPTDIFPWWVQKLKKNEIIEINDVMEMPAAASAEQQILSEQDIKSVMAVPMMIDGELFGCFGFDNVKEKRKFGESRKTLLKLLTEIISNAFAKYLNDKKIKSLTFKDQLTGLYNRLFVSEEMQRLNTERQLPISIIMLDINGLKLANDSYGHEYGDKLIKKTARIIKETFRKEDIKARWGGDEFIIFLPKTAEKEAEKIIERLENTISKTSNEYIPLSVGIGFAVKTKECTDIDYVINKADESMYQDKLLKGKKANNMMIKKILKELGKNSFIDEESSRMQKITDKFADHLNLSKELKGELKMLVDLHDIGEITIPKKIIIKKDKLNNDEWELIKKHPEKGAAIVNSTDSYSHLSKYIKHHHEWWDGSGYPEGLKGKKIPFLSRIMLIIDAYDVMRSGRPYQKALTKNEALREIENNSARQFDPELAEEFIKIMENEELL